jgi:hypothetical protein
MQERTLAYATIYFENPRTGQVKEAPVGFSWTVLFFNFFPALFRGHWAGFAILIIAAFVTFGLSGLVFMFIYNKMYVKHLIGEGYKAKSATTDLDDIQQKMGLQLPRLDGVA